MSLTSQADAQADALATMIRGVVREELGNVISPFVYATFVAAEALDANLSKVTLSGTTEQARFVPKLVHVTGLAAGNTLLCIKGKGVPLTIVGRVAGDISIASV